jgi:NAD(P)-dependent dehydrogenase (short-subunit alcohol dehydrogenase family)
MLLTNNEGSGMGRLKGKVAIVTGSAHGIGRASAIIMAREGARVCIADLNAAGARKVAAEIAQSGGEAIAFEVDIANESQIQAMVSATVAAFGAVDVLQNTAAATSAEQSMADGLIHEARTEIWDKAYNITLRGSMLCCKHVIPHMLTRGKGSIINISSTAGIVGQTFVPAYGATKAGLHSLSQYIACQYGRQGIRANTVAPGLIRTPTTETLGAEFLKMCADNCVAGHIGEPEDVGHVTAFLASDEARYLTGQLIPVDGGQVMHTPLFAELNRMADGKINLHER